MLSPTPTTLEQALLEIQRLLDLDENHLLGISARLDGKPSSPPVHLNSEMQQAWSSGWWAQDADIIRQRDQDRYRLLMEESDEPPDELYILYPAPFGGTVRVLRSGERLDKACDKVLAQRRQHNA